MSYADELRQEGRQEGVQEVARNLLKSGIDTSIVAKATHLSAKQIEELKKAIC
jgi:predicted transposase/invertase (TIGR01784 family)